MTIYKHKSEDYEQTKSLSKDPAVVLTDDDETSENDDQVKTVRPTMIYRRRMSVLTWFVVLLVVFVVFSSLITIFWYRKSSSKPLKPYIALVPMHYHTWKDNAAGEKRAFKVEGVFHQQVEIDIHNKTYEKLNVPPVLKAQRAEILHDFQLKWTAIVNLYRGHCFVLPLNSTFVAPLDEFYQLVKNIEAGYDSTDAEIISDDYSVLSMKVINVSQFGSIVLRYCQYLETYRLIRDDQPQDGLNRKPACHFRGQQFCLGGAGTKYMGMVHISQCVQ